MDFSSLWHLLHFINEFLLSINRLTIYSRPTTLLSFSSEVVCNTSHTYHPDNSFQNVPCSYDPLTFVHASLSVFACIFCSHTLPDDNVSGPTAHLSNSLNDSDEDSLYVSVQEYTVHHGSELERDQRRGPGKAIPYELLPHAQWGASINTGKPAVSPFATRWPQLRWPSDAWLLLAEAFIAGLETAFGGFVHGFTVRYLMWSPVSNCGNIVLSLVIPISVKTGCRVLKLATASTIVKWKRYQKFFSFIFGFSSYGEPNEELGTLGPRMDSSSCFNRIAIGLSKIQ